MGFTDLLALKTAIHHGLLLETILQTCIMHAQIFQETSPLTRMGNIRTKTKILHRHRNLYN